GQVSVILPPIETDLLRLVDGAHDESNADREQLDFGERDLDVARHDQTLVENSIEYVDEPAGATVRELEICSHPKGRSSSTLAWLAESIGCLRTQQQVVKSFSHSTEVSAKAELYLRHRPARKRDQDGGKDVRGGGELIDQTVASCGVVHEAGHQGAPRCERPRDGKDETHERAGLLGPEQVADDGREQGRDRP